MIEINNMTANAVDEKFFRQVAENVLKGENKKKRDLSIAFVGEGRMRKLNKKYRKTNRVTDVLSFGENNRFLVFPKNKAGLGEVIICLRVVKKNARKYASFEAIKKKESSKESKASEEYDLTFKKETAQVLIHGILHLLGYDHKGNKKEAILMEKKQEHYLSRTLDI